MTGTKRGTVLIFERPLLTIIDVDLLRVGSRSQSRCQEMERSCRPPIQHACCRYDGIAYCSLTASTTITDIIRLTYVLLVFFIFLVPGGTDGPSGVLVCSENYITYKHIGAATLTVPIPRRKDPLENKDRGLLIVSGVVHKMKVRILTARNRLSLSERAILVWHCERFSLRLFFSPYCVP